MGIVWARLRFEELFHNQIAQLLFNFPLDMVTSSGTPFWSGPKRPPTPLQFDENDPLHMEFIVATANLRAFNYGLTSRIDVEFFKSALESVMVPEFMPRGDVKIQANPEEKQDVSLSEEEDVCDEIARSLPPPSSLAGYRMTPVNFEKDDDANFHIDFITASSNLRARNYQIAEADRHRIKQIAAPMKRIDQTSKEWSLWDRYEVDEGRDITLKEFLELFKDRHKLEVTMISSGVSILYSFFTNRKKLAERMPLTMSELVVEVSKVEYKPTQRYINFEICCNDESDEDVEVPYVKYKFRGWA